MGRWKWVVLGVALPSIALWGLLNRHWITGLLHGERFFSGKPTSYWSAKVKKWTHVRKTIPSFSLDYDTSAWRAFLQRYMATSDNGIEELFLPDGKVKGASVDVLLQMLESSDR